MKKLEIEPDDAIKEKLIEYYKRIEKLTLIAVGGFVESLHFEDLKNMGGVIKKLNTIIDATSNASIVDYLCHYPDTEVGKYTQDPKLRPVLLKYGWNSYLTVHDVMYEAGTGYYISGNSIVKIV